MLPKNPVTVPINASTAEMPPIHARINVQARFTRGSVCGASLVIIVSTRIDEAQCHHAQCGDTGQKEVIASAQLDEVRQMATHERRVRGRGITLNDEATMASVIAHENVLIIAKVGVVAILDPLLLHELELAREA